MLCDDRPRNWAQYLPEAVAAYNNCYNVTLQDSPHFLHFGVDPHLPFNILRNEGDVVTKNDQAAVIQYCYELAIRNVKQQQLLRDHRNRDKPLRRQVYDVGDLVYLRAVFVSQQAYKLRFPFRGPFRIIKIEGSTVHLKSLTTGKIKRASMRNIRIYAAESVSKSEHPNASEPVPLEEDPDSDSEGEELATESAGETEPAKVDNSLAPALESPSDAANGHQTSSNVPDGSEEPSARKPKRSVRTVKQYNLRSRDRTPLSGEA